MQFPPQLNKLFKTRFKHRELVFWSVGILLFGFLFVRLLILPTGRHSRHLLEKIDATKKHYQEILGEEESVERIVFSLKEALMELEETLPRQEKISVILTALSKKANEFGIDVISVRPESAVPYPNKDHPIRLEEKICEALSIQMELRCTYRVLGGYLESLEEKFPSTLTIDGLAIQKEGGKSSLLKVTLFMTTYLFVGPT